jgi:hypothetical protein
MPPGSALTAWSVPIGERVSPISAPLALSVKTNAVLAAAKDRNFRLLTHPQDRLK